MGKSTIVNQGFNAQMKTIDRMSKTMRKPFAYIFGIVFVLLMGVNPFAMAQNQGKPYVNNKSNHVSTAGRVVTSKSHATYGGRTLHFAVKGNLPALAKVTATPVQRTNLAGDAVIGAYDISVADGDAEWQPQKGQLALVTITDPSFVDGKLMDIYHEGANGNEFVATVSPTNHTITFPAYSFSVYIVTGSDENARLKVNYVQITGDTVSYYVKATDTLDMEQFKRIVYDPGVGATPNPDITFYGWTTNAGYTTANADDAITIAGVRDTVIA